MKMELIQPFINSADAVLSQGLQCTTSIAHLSMEEEAYRRKGVAAMVWLTGDIEGRIIFDLDPQTAVRVAPVLHTSEEGTRSSEDTEALVMCFETASGNVFMNIALRYNRRRQVDHAAVAGQ